MTESSISTPLFDGQRYCVWTLYHIYQTNQTIYKKSLSIKGTPIYLLHHQLIINSGTMTSLFLPYPFRKPFILQEAKMDT